MVKFSADDLAYREGGGGGAIHVAAKTVKYNTTVNEWVVGVISRFDDLSVSWRPEQSFMKLNGTYAHCHADYMYIGVYWTRFVIFRPDFHVQFNATPPVCRMSQWSI